jgi:large subunit ribosomal protein L23
MENKNLNLGKLLNLIKYPLITEKTVNLYKNQQYTFIVDRKLTKTEIKFIIEKIFSVSVKKINTSLIPSKKRRIGKFTGENPQYKKTYIKLKKGYDIPNIFNY